MSAVGCQHPVLYYENHSGSPELSRCHEENAHHHGEHIRHTEEESSRNNTVPPSDSVLEPTTDGHGPEFSCCINLAGAASTAEASFRPMKRRGKARRKERRRTQNINSAFSALRDRIPNVPTDTKLSKIKTLRLATSYIAYLMNLLDTDDQNGETETFRAEFIKTDFKEDERRKELNEVLKTSENKADPRPRGRTGWPQYVWALELKL